MSDTYKMLSLNKQSLSHNTHGHYNIMKIVIIWLIWAKAILRSSYLRPGKRDNELLSYKFTGNVCLLSNESEIMLYNRKRLCKIKKISTIYNVNYKFNI